MSSALSKLAAKRNHIQQVHGTIIMRIIILPGSVWQIYDLNQTVQVFFKTT